MFEPFDFEGHLMQIAKAVGTDKECAFYLKTVPENVNFHTWKLLAELSLGTLENAHFAGNTLFATGIFYTPVSLNRLFHISVANNNYRNNMKEFWEKMDKASVSWLNLHTEHGRTNNIAAYLWLAHITAVKALEVLGSNSYADATAVQQQRETNPVFDAICREGENMFQMLVAS